MVKADELIRDFTRVRVTPLRIFVEVRVVDEDREDPLAMRWTMAALLPPKAPGIDVDRARLRVLADYRYFRTCELCHERRHASAFAPGAQSGRDVCQDCAEDVLPE